MEKKKKRSGAVCMLATVLAALFLMTIFVSSGIAEKHEQFKMHMHGAVPGSSGQIITFGWADLINKNSDWLKVTVSEEAGPGAAVALFVKVPEKRKNSVIMTLDGQPPAWSAGKPPLTPKQPYDTWTLIANVVNVPYGILTFDPNIKTIKDLDGKKFANLGRRIPAAWAMDNILKTAGIKPKMDWLDPVSGKDALLSGLVDAVLEPLSNDAPDWTPFPIVTEILASKDTYFVDFTKEAMEKGFKSQAWPQLPTLQVPQGVYAPTQQAYWGFYTGNYYAVDKEMPEEVVYEMLRIMYEQIDKFKTYHPIAGSMSRNNMGNVPASDEHKHPGAIKFYKDKGLPYGRP